MMRRSQFLLRTSARDRWFFLGERQSFALSLSIDLLMPTRHIMFPH